MNNSYWIGVFCGLWCIGWLWAIAKISAAVDRNKIPKPDGAKWAVPLLLFFTWPYWFFYWRA